MMRLFTNRAGERGPTHGGTGVLLRSLFRFSLLPMLLLASGTPAADLLVPMQDKGASTYYVSVSIEGWGTGDFLVDTGSSYMTINRRTLAKLEEDGKVTYVKDLLGRLADGSELVVPIYLIDSIRIGKSCVLTDVKAAVFTGTERHILGLSALRRAAPFSFSLKPPVLALSGCDSGGTKTASADS